jgi:hypothetical protein
LGSRAVVKAVTPDTNRTCDLLIRNQLLYPLSYGGVVVPVSREREPSTGRGDEPATSRYVHRVYRGNRMRSLLSTAIVVAASGCTTFEEPFQLTLPSEGVTRIDAALDQGDFGYRGSVGASEFTIDGVSTGSASKGQKAEEREAGNTWEAEVAEGALIVRSDSRFVQAEVNMDVSGPDLLNVEVSLPDGSAWLEDVEGTHFALADFVTTRRLRGSANLSGSSGIDAEIWPFIDGQVILDAASGSVRLALPFGGPYDIEVWGAPGYTMNVTDLGFSRQTGGDGYFAAESGAATVRIEVTVRGGDFTLAQAL